MLTRALFLYQYSIVPITLSSFGGTQEEQGDTGTETDGVGKDVTTGGDTGPAITVTDGDSESGTAKSGSGSGKKRTAPPETIFKKLSPSYNRYTLLRDELQMKNPALRCKFCEGEDKCWKDTQDLY